MHPKQMSLFNTPTLNISRPLKAAMNEAAKQCGLSRDQIVDRMNDLADRYGVSLANGNARKLTLETFAKWLNPEEKSRQIPVKALPVFCAAVNSAEPMKVLSTPLGFEVIGDEDQNLLRWAKAYQQARKARKIMRRLEPEVNIQEET